MLICWNAEGVHGKKKRKRLGTPDLNNVTLTAYKLVFGIYELEFCAGQEPTFAGQV